MGWKPLHPDERIEHERERQSIKGRTSRYWGYLRHHPRHALRPFLMPLIIAAVATLVVFVAVF